MLAVMCLAGCPVMRAMMSGETLVACPRSLGTISFDRMTSGGGVSISSYGFSYLLALRGTGHLSVGVIRHQQNSAS